MTKLSPLEMNYLMDSIEEVSQTADIDIGLKEELMYNCLVILKGAQEHATDEEIPMSIETWQSPSE